ncbi:MAG: Tetratricopeptide repeat protein [Elusimicrobia bacterium ADurb.Bin231]|nr:MAG: Tetratricopeptide repeat protein [Elusimicrobia bacterium ADurb.Bin231]
MNLFKNASAFAAALIFLCSVSFVGCGKSEFKKWKQQGMSAETSEEQIECFTNALDSWTEKDGNRDKAIVYTKRGNAYADMGHFGMALGDYTTAIAIDPRCSEAYSKKASLDGTISNLSTSQD